MVVFYCMQFKKYSARRYNIDVCICFSYESSWNNIIVKQFS